MKKWIILGLLLLMVSCVLATDPRYTSNFTKEVNLDYIEGDWDLFSFVNTFQSIVEGKRNARFWNRKWKDLRKGRLRP